MPASFFFGRVEEVDTRTIDTVLVDLWETTNRSLLTEQKIKNVTLVPNSKTRPSGSHGLVSNVSRPSRAIRVFRIARCITPFGLGTSSYKSEPSKLFSLKVIQSL